jgi:hypothetical protein
MASANRIEPYVRRAGVAAGVALVAVLVLAFRVPDGSGTLGADVIVAISPTGELGVSRPGPFMSATGLRPGGVLTGEVEVSNQTGRRLAVRLRALPDSKDLDRLLVVDVRAGHGTRPIFTGRLGGLRAKTPAFRLDSGRKRALRVRASLPAGLRSGYAGRIATISLELSSSLEPAGD